MLTDELSGPCECSFLFQRLSFVVQRFNGVLLHDSFYVEDQPYY